MNFDKRAYTFYKEAVSLKCGEMIIPRTAVIYPVYGCNLNCPGCFYNLYNIKKEFMSFDNYLSISHQLKSYGINSIEFCGGGEPLLNPNITKFISWTSYRLHIPYGLITNGTLLSDDLSYLLAFTGVYARISLYDNSFDTVIPKIKKLIKIRNQFGTSLKITGKLSVYKGNVKKIKYLCTKLLSINPDYITIKAVRNNPDEISEDDKQEIENEIKKINDPRISCSLNKTKIHSHCWLSPLHTLIDPLGNVYICCYYTHRSKTHCLGNVFKQEFKKIWESENHFQKINKIKISECNLFDCRWHIYTKELNALFKTNTTHHQFS